MKNRLGKTAAFILAGLICSYAEVIFQADFNSDTDGFTYRDDVFRGTSQPGYATGAREIYDPFTGYMSVAVGGMDAAIVQNMSGAWEVSFNVPSQGDVELQFDYNLDAAPDYESNEYSEILVAIDGQLRGTNGNDYIVRIYDGGVENMPNSVVSLGNLSPGNHTLAIGTYNNRKSEQAEETVLWFDNVVVNLEPDPDPDPPTTCESLPSDPDDPYARIPISEENVIIVNCGSYYLTQSITGVSIEVDNVNLDLNGYRVNGGIFVQNANTVRIYNGNTIEIQINGDAVSIDNVNVTNGFGINIQRGASFQITNSNISRNTKGISHYHEETVASGIIRDNVIEYNSGDGISFKGHNLLIQNNTISSNDGMGISLESNTGEALILQNKVTRNIRGNIIAPSATLFENRAP